MCSSAPALAVKPSAASSAANSPLREACPTCSGLVIVPKFAFTPEENDRGQPQGRRCRVRRQSQQMAARRGRTEHADRRGRMPALLVVMEVDAARDPRLRLPPGDVRGNERAPIDRARLRQREQRRQYRRRWMSAQRVAAIVEVERVRRGAVDQRGIQRRHTLRRAEHQARAARRGHPRTRYARRVRWRRPACSRPCRGSQRAPSAARHPAAARRSGRSRSVRPAFRRWSWLSSRSPPVVGRC